MNSKTLNCLLYNLLIIVFVYSSNHKNGTYNDDNNRKLRFQWAEDNLG